MKDEFGSMGRNDLGGEFAASARTLAVNVEKYQTFLDGTDLTDAQKEEFLQALWSVVVSFVELGYEVHPLQEVCGQDFDESFQNAKAALDQVRSKEPDNDKPPTAARKKADLEA